jgi:hypothetical protein
LGPVTHRKTDCATAHISLFEISNDSLVLPDEATDATNGEVVPSSDGANIDYLASDPTDDEVDGVLFPFSPRNSRPISLYDETIDPADRAILEHGYDWNSWSDPNNQSVHIAFVRFIGAQYGKSINNPVLRQATILYLTALSNHDDESTLLRRARLLPALQFRISQINLVDDVDLFATFLLMNHFMVVGDRDGALISLRGCQAIIRHLSDQSAPNEIQCQFKSLWPMMLFYMCAYSLVLGDIPSTLECHGVLISRVTTKRVVPHFLRPLNLPCESMAHTFFAAISTVHNCFLDLGDELASKKKGYPRQSDFQNVRTELENGSARWESYLRSVCLGNLAWPHAALWLRCAYALDILKFVFSYLFLGALYAGQEKADTLAVQHESGAFFTTFLQEVGILEIFFYRIESELFTSNVCQLAPDIENLIGEAMEWQSTDT